jgi:hypothetical protein
MPASDGKEGLIGNKGIRIQLSQDSGHGGWLSSELRAGFNGGSPNECLHYGAESGQV